MSAIFFNVPAISLKLIILLTNFWRIDKAEDLLDVMYKRCLSHEERVQVNEYINLHTVTNIYIIAYVMVPTTKFFSSLLSIFFIWYIFQYGAFVIYISQTLFIFVYRIMYHFIALLRHPVYTSVMYVTICRP